MAIVNPLHQHQTTVNGSYSRFILLGLLYSYEDAESKVLGAFIVWTKNIYKIHEYKSFTGTPKTLNSQLQQYDRME